MSVVLSIPRLFDAVVARFALESTDIELTFGWREPTKHKRTVARIVWVPGSPSGAIGNMDAPSKTGDREKYRSLGTLRELFTVHIEANDPVDPENERAQYIATRLAFDAWYRAVYLAAHGTFGLESSEWNTLKNERRNGTEMICVCYVDAVVPDSPWTLAPADTEADIDTSLDDVTEKTLTATP